MSVTAMNNQELEQYVLHCFDFYPTSSERVGKITKLHCQGKTYALKKSRASAEQIAWLEHCFHLLQRVGFSSFLPFVKNKYGDSYTCIEDYTFYCTQWIEDKIEDKYSGQWESTVLKKLGQLHAYSKKSGLSERVIDQHKPMKLELVLEKWKHRLMMINEYKQFALERPFMSPFESTFVTSFEYVNELAVRAIKYLTAFSKKYQLSSLKKVLCHCQIHRKHILTKQENIFFCDFDQAQMDTPVKDLVSFYRTHAEQAFADKTTHVAHQWLAAYEGENRLDDIEKLLFAIMLLFPEKLFKEVEQYYLASRDWSPQKQARYYEKQVQITYTIRKFAKELLSEIETDKRDGLSDLSS